MNPQDKMDLQVAEEQDGSAVVQLPPGESPHAGKDDEGQNDQYATGGTVDDDGDDGDNGTPDADPEREAIRQARREERQLKKKLQKAKASESNHLINSLKRQNEQMAERLAVLEKRTAGSDLARLDKAIEDSQLRLQYAKHQNNQATEMADGAALAEANEAWYEARRQVESLEALKKRAVESNNDPRGSVPKAPDPMLKRHASNWMARNDWYDPNGKDMDSRITTKVDEALMEEGWDPTSSEYWEELDNRLTKYLPHRYNGGNDDTPSRSSERRPRSVVTGSGRESTPASRPGEFRLSPERVKAIKEAGRWDNVAERNKMIRKYAEYDRMQNNRG